MYEGIILIVLVVLVVLAIRPARPIVRCEAGRYHATLAPQLGRVIRLVELICAEFSGENELATQYFEMQDEVGKFLMAVGYRGGLLYFQAILPPGDENYQTIRLFSDQVMVNIPLVSSQQDAAPLLQVVEAAAARQNISCKYLSPIDE